LPSADNKAVSRRPWNHFLTKLGISRVIIVSGAAPEATMVNSRPGTAMYNVYNSQIKDDQTAQGRKSSKTLNCQLWFTAIHSSIFVHTFFSLFFNGRSAVSFNHMDLLLSSG
jgi:hypothetical protein